MTRTTHPLTRGHVLFVAVLAVLLGGVAFACGSDDGNGPENCNGTLCDGGSESSTADGQSSTTDGPGTDTSIGDGGGGGDVDADGDSSILVSCGDGGAGTLDPTFGDGGVVWLKYPTSGANAVVVQPDGKIVVGGYTYGSRKFAVVRLLSDGSLDPTFGTAGLVETKLGTLNPGYVALALQGDGKIVAVGTTTYTAGKQADFAVVRYLANGGLDRAFGDGGAVVTDFSATNDNPASVRLLADGRILVGGQSEPTGANPNTDFALARLNADGSLDTTFGTGGKVTIDVHGTQDHGGYVALLSGKAVIAGQTGTTPGNSVFEVSSTEVNGDGTPNPAFADAGKLVTSFGGSGSQRVYSVAVDATGRILLGGADEGVAAGSGSDFGIMRLTSSGALDPTFGDGGSVTTDIAMEDVVSALVLQDDGRIVAAGFSDMGSGTFGIAVARYLTSGKLDPTFGAGGRATMPPPPNADLNATAAAISGCGIIVVGTWGYDNNTLPDTAMGIARYRR